MHMESCLLTNVGPKKTVTIELAEVICSVILESSLLCVIIDESTHFHSTEKLIF